MHAISFGLAFYFLILALLPHKSCLAVEPLSPTSRREAWLSRFHSGEMGPLSSLYPLSRLWQLTLLKDLAVIAAVPIRGLHTTTYYHPTPMQPACHPSCLLHRRLAKEKQTRARMPSCIKHGRNPACHCRSYRHTSPPYEWQQARERKSSGYCSQAGHLHSTVCSDRDRRGPCTLPSSGAPEGSSAPEARSHPSPVEALPCGWSLRPKDAWGHVMQTSSISSCKVTTLAAVIPA